jgi:ATP-binding cassette subfamily B protein
MLEMIPVTKAHGLEKKEISSVNHSIKKLAGAGREMDKTVAVFGTWMWIVSTALSSACLVFCAILALLGQIEIGDIVLYQAMFSSISAYVSSIVSTLPSLSSGFDAADSISEIMNSKDVEANLGKPMIEKISGDIEFKDVCYKYPNSKGNVINDFSLKVKKGECIAVVGASGSGKSTLMNMIIGL